MTKAQLEAIVGKSLTDEEFVKVAEARGERAETSSPGAATVVPKVGKGPTTYEDAVIRSSESPSGSEKAGSADWVMRDNGMEKGWSPPAAAYDSTHYSWDPRYSYSPAPASAPVAARGGYEPSAVGWTPAGAPEHAAPQPPATTAAGGVYQYIPTHAPAPTYKGKMVPRGDAPALPTAPPSSAQTVAYPSPHALEAAGYPAMGPKPAPGLGPSPHAQDAAGYSFRDPMTPDSWHYDGVVEKTPEGEKITMGAVLAKQKKSGKK